MGIADKNDVDMSLIEFVLSSEFVWRTTALSFTYIAVEGSLLYCLCVVSVLKI